MLRKILPLFLFASISLFGWSAEIDIKLNQEEVEWIKQVKEKEIVIYLDNDLGILSRNIENGAEGIYLQVISALKKLTGLNFKVIKEERREFQKAIDSGKPHVVMGVENYMQNRNAYYYLKDPLRLSGVFIARNDYPISDSNTDLSGKTIAYIEGDQIVNEVVKRYGPRIILMPKPTLKDAVESLMKGEADIYVDDLQDGLKSMIENPDFGVKLNYISPLLETNYYIGGLYQYKPLVDIIGKLLENLNFNRKNLYKDILNYIENNELEIFREIGDYINKNETLKVFIPRSFDKYPILYRDTYGRRKGFFTDYFHKVENILGVNIVFEEFASLEECQIISTIFAVNGHDINNKGFLISDPYIEFNFFIFNREEEKYIPSLEVLRKYRIAVQKNSIAELYLRYMGMKKNLVIFDTQKEIIEAVSSGKVEILIGNIQNIHYLLDKYSIRNIKVAGIMEDKISLKLGVPKENKTLYFIINSFTRFFSTDIEKKKKEFFEKKLEVTRDYKASIIITLISILGFLGLIIHLRRFKRMYSKVTNITLSLVETIENANKYNDEDTGNHIKRIAKYSQLIARELKLSKSFIREVELYASLHDIGKIGIPDSILKKPGKLTIEEFEKMKKHTEIGFNIIKNLEVSPVALNIIRYHHEKWDGSGYGRGFKGKEIPLEARIVALADVYDALRQKRSYKEAFSHKKAIEIIISEKGKHFDPVIVDIFIKKQNDFNKIFNK